MNFENLIAVDEKKGLVSFQGKDSNLITCKGSSDLQITGGRKYAESFVVSGLRKDCKNLLVVTVNIVNDKRRPLGHVSFILEIECYKHQEENRTIVKRWTPSIVDRIATVDEYGNIEMRIGDKIFSTHPKRQDGSYYVNNPDVCLNYLAGRINYEDVMAAAEETQKQIDLQERCTHLEHEAEYLQEECDRLNNLNRSHSEDLHLLSVIEKGLQKNHKSKVESLTEEIESWKNAATKLRDAVNSPLLKRVYGCSRRGGGFVYETRRTRINKALKVFPDFVEPRFYPDPLENV